MNTPSRPKTPQELCQWLRDCSSGIYRPSADAADLIERLERENSQLREAIEEMDRIHSDIMENGPRCTCGEGDEWCRHCGKSIKLSSIASRALKA